MSGYKGIGQQDPVTKQWKQFNPEVIAQYVDINEDLHKALKNLAEEAGGSEVVRVGDQWLTKTGNKWERIDPTRVKLIAGNLMMGNQKYMNMITQQARWMGMDPEEAVLQDMASRANTMAGIYSKDNRWTTIDMSVNRYGLLNATMDALTPPGQTMAGPIENIEAQFGITSSLKEDLGPRYTTIGGYYAKTDNLGEIESKDQFNM